MPRAQHDAKARLRSSDEKRRSLYSPRAIPLGKT